MSRTVPAAHASLAGESGPAMQHTPIVEDCAIRSISSNSAARLRKGLIRTQHFTRLELEPVHVVRVAENGVEAAGRFGSA